MEDTHVPVHVHPVQAGGTASVRLEASRPNKADHGMGLSFLEVKSRRLVAM